MTGRRYYLTNLGAWNRHAAHFAHSHWLSLDAPGATEVRDSMTVLAIVEADEGTHLRLEDDPEFEALPSPLAEKPISDAARSALALHGLPVGATTFEAAEAAGRIHPLLRHRVF